MKSHHEEEDTFSTTLFGEETTSHPLLPNSIMTYAHAKRDNTDYPGYAEKLKESRKWAEDGIIDTKDCIPIRVLDYLQILNGKIALQKRFNVMSDFMDLVQKFTAQDIIGHWGTEQFKVDTLNTLAAFTAFAVLLTNNPDPRRVFNFEYSEIHDKSSRLYRYSDAMREQFEHAQQRDLILTGKRGKAPDPAKLFISTFYMLDFTPKQLFVAKATHPHVRIVGITTSNLQQEKEIEAILKAREEARNKMKK